MHLTSLYGVNCFLIGNSKNITLKHQPVTSGKKISLQDNTSAIQLERYGKRSSTKNTCHILIIYFYVTDKLQEKTLTAISYCPTKEMVSSHLSKPLQGSLFQTHRNAIMGTNEQDEANSFNTYKTRLEQQNPNG